MHISELLIRTTIRIQTVFSNDEGAGTGFFYAFQVNKYKNTHIPAIVTNKHVVKGALNAKLRFSLKDSNGNAISGMYHDLNISDFEKHWIMHPEDDIDLCILPTASIHREIQNSKQDLYYTCLFSEYIPTLSELEVQFSKIEDIIVVGYPDGIWDSYNNIPIVRKGITATPLQINFENAPKFLIDAAIYGGSSGSPVFVFNQGSYSTADGNLYVGNRIKFVGIVYAVAQHTVTGELKIQNIPSVKKPITQTLIPNNLGVVIKAEKMYDFESILKYKFGDINN